jgi:hypothetical protein
MIKHLQLNAHLVSVTAMLKRDICDLQLKIMQILGFNVVEL